MMTRKTIANGLMVAVLAMGMVGLTVGTASASPFLSVDFSQSTDTPLQTGFEGFSFDDASSHTLTYPRAEATDGTVDVSLSGQTHYRDYATLTGGPYVGLSDLLSDSALIASPSGTAPTPTGTPMTLTLGDLKAGTYNITTYHHNSDRGSATLMWYLTDSVVTDDLKFTGITTGSDVGADSATAPPAITTVTETFVANGTDDVLIKMYNVNPTAGSQTQVKINGFELISDSATPGTLIYGK